MTLTLAWTDNGRWLSDLTQRDSPEPGSDTAEYGEAPQL